MVIKDYNGKPNIPTMEIYGSSTDDKPIGTYEGLKINESSVFVEIDTGKVYLYSSAETWCEL